MTNHEPTNKSYPSWLINTTLLTVLVGLALYFRLRMWDELVGPRYLSVFYDDPPYHLRRALMYFFAWPHLPSFDPYVNFPYGARIFFPPGLAWIMAALAKLSGAAPSNVKETMEKIALFFPPLIGTITVVATYLVGRRLSNRLMAFLVAACLAVVPAHLQYSHLGRFDHHFFEPLLVGLILYCIAAGTTAHNLRQSWAWAALGALAQAWALVLWPSFLLQLGLLVMVILLSAAQVDSHNSRRLLDAAYRSFALAILTSLPIVWLSPWAREPVFYAPSPLHLACMAAASCLFYLLGYPPLLTKKWPPILRASLAFCFSTLLLLVVPTIRAALFAGLSFLDKNSFIALSGESVGITKNWTDYLQKMSWIASICSVLALFIVAKNLLRKFKNNDEASSQTTIWFSLILSTAGLFFLLGLHSARWLMSWIPFGLLALIPVYQHLLLPLGRKNPKQWAGLWLFIGGALIIPSIYYSQTLVAIPEEYRIVQAFVRNMRKFLPPAAAEEYSATSQPQHGVLSVWSIGHLLTYVAGQPTLANNFVGLPTHDRANRQAFEILLEKNCEQAAMEMRKHKLRYLFALPFDLKSAARFMGLDPLALMNEQGEFTMRGRRAVVVRLGLNYGEGLNPNVEAMNTSESLAACGHFRLLATDRVPQKPPAEPVDIKLYELVPAAQLKVQAAPHTGVEVYLPIQIDNERKVDWFSRALTDEKGQATLDLPYPTVFSPNDQQPLFPVRPLINFYQVRVSQRIYQVTVSVEAVRQGLVNSIKAD